MVAAAASVRDDVAGSRAQLARDNLIVFTRRMYPGYRAAGHHWRIARALHAIEAGEIDRLVITMPPRHGKSTLASEHFPAWFLGRNPDARVIAASYAATLAYRFSRRARNLLARPEWPFPGVATAGDLANVQSWDIADHRGGYYAAGVGGGITGHGADCVTGETPAVTPYGEVPAATLHRLKYRGKVLSYDHENNVVVWRDVVASREIASDDLWEVGTRSGRVLRATGNHPVYVSGRGYRAVREIAVGDAAVRLMRQTGYADGVGGFEGHPQRSSHRCVLGGVSESGDEWGAAGSLLPLRRADPAVAPPVLLGRVRGGATTGADDGGVPGVRADLEPAAGRAGAVLLAGMRGEGPCAADAGGGQQPLQDGALLRALVPLDAAAGAGAGRASLRGLRDAGGVQRDALEGQDRPPLGPRDPSRQRGPGGQPGRESRRPVQDVPHDPPQVEDDPVVVVRRVCGGTQPVYDLQVAGTHNFFAGSLLVHNCLLIDDPVASAEQAESATSRERAWEWFTQDALTRLEPGGRAVLIGTRWHEDDLIGRALAMPGARWEHLDLPALGEDGDPLGREPGAPLWPERYDAAALASIRTQIGTRAFAALYQQRPSPAEGAILKREWWRSWREPLPAFDWVVTAWDTAFKAGRENDWSVGLTVGAAASGFYVLDRWRARVEFPELERAVQDQFTRWEPDEVLIEDAASGQSLLQRLARGEADGPRLPIAGFRPDRDKLARVNAVSPYVEGGGVFLPADAPWREEFVEELAAFPGGAHDDQVDGFSMAILRLAQRAGTMRALDPAALGFEGLP